jgi:Dolichyl-phosphate-mannose-protein mannosyltransferase
VPAAVFAGDRRVWRAAAIVAVPLLAVIVFYCVRPRFYFTGTDSVEDAGGAVAAGAGSPVCVPDLLLPADTAGVRLQVFSPTSERPALTLTLHVGTRTLASRLAPASVRPEHASNADFQIPETPAHPAASAASLCVRAAGAVHWGGTSLPSPGSSPPTSGGLAQPARLALWYLPRSDRRSSYLSRAGQIFSRAALFRPGIVGPWTYPVLLFVLLPALALLALRCLAIASAGDTRGLAASLFAIAALNAGCWALLTPAFQAPDEVDHFAYVQSIVERGEKPSADERSPLARWSSAEELALEGESFATDHQVGDTKAPWRPAELTRYRARARRLRPSRSDGGGYTTSAVHGPPYYLALAPAYLATREASVFSQLTLMRFTSALLGALVVLFTYLLARELAPRRPWLAALAALLVAYQPMYGFISGVVNNDVGVNAVAAALELLLIRLLRRGITVPWGALTGAVLILLPSVKETGLSLYPVAGLVFIAALWRHHRRSDLPGWGALVLTAVIAGELYSHALLPAFAMPSAAGGAAPAPALASSASAVEGALHNIPDFLSYLWQVFLPRLSFMTPHFPSGVHPGFVIFIERGWGAFGWYDVLFPHRVYDAILVVSLLALVLAPWAAVREWVWLRRHWVEALAVILMPIAVITGFVAAYYTPGARPAIAEFGRYAFPAIGPIALLVVGALHAFGRRRMLFAGAGLAVAMIALSYASQLLTLTSFYG